MLYYDRIDAYEGINVNVKYKQIKRMWYFTTDTF